MPLHHQLESRFRNFVLAADCTLDALDRSFWRYQNISCGITERATHFTPPVAPHQWLRRTNLRRTLERVFRHHFPFAAAGFLQNGRSTSSQFSGRRFLIESKSL